MSRAEQTGKEYQLEAGKLKRPNPVWDSAFFDCVL
jgi:hypothetical protein